MEKATAKFDVSAEMSEAPSATDPDPQEQKGLELISAAPPAVAHEMDRLSLNQALIDFEIANLRAMDLTQRLMETARENQNLKGQVEPLSAECIRWKARTEELQAELGSVRAQYDRLLATKAYKLMKLIWAVRRVLRV